MKSYMTAEKFEEEAEKIQQKYNRIVKRLNAYCMKKIGGLYAELNDDQKIRVQTRKAAKMRQQQEEMIRKIEEKGRQIVHPGNFRVN